MIRSRFAIPLALLISSLGSACATGGAEAPPPAAPAAGPDAPKVGQQVTTPSGLKYTDLVQGTGAMAHAGQKAKVHYTGWLKDGTEFDSSRARGPFEFTIGGGQVIRGWDEGLLEMKVGGKRQLVIPSDLAYGERGSPGGIPPNAELKFEIELLGLE
jgi:peptidylprolyl isomerase